MSWSERVSVTAFNIPLFFMVAMEIFSWQPAQPTYLFLKEQSEQRSSYAMLNCVHSSLLPADSSKWQGGVRNQFSTCFLLHQIFSKALWFWAVATFLLSSQGGWKNTCAQKLLMTKHLFSVTFLHLLCTTPDSALSSVHTLLCKSLTLQPGDETMVLYLLALIENSYWCARLLQRSLLLSAEEWSIWFLKWVIPWRPGLLFLQIWCAFLQKDTAFEPPEARLTESLLLLPLGEEGISRCTAVKQQKALVTFRCAQVSCYSRKQSR